MCMVQRKGECGLRRYTIGSLVLLFDSSLLITKIVLLLLLVLLPTLKLVFWGFFFVRVINEIELFNFYLDFPAPFFNSLAHFATLMFA
jgi:hypothetical protein